jgi:hypothetical protein
VISLGWGIRLNPIQLGKAQIIAVKAHHQIKIANNNSGVVESCNQTNSPNSIQSHVNKIAREKAYSFP